MIKQVFGSFFRTIGRIIAYLAFGALLALIFQNKDVFALEGSYNYYTQTGYYYEYTENNIEGYESNKYFDVEDLSNTGAITGSTDATLKQKNNYVNGDVKTDYLARFRLRIYGNSDSIYEKDNSYTFRFSFNFRYIQNVNSSLETNFYTLLQNKYYIETVTGNTSASSTDASSDYISSFSYYWTKPDTTGRYFLFVNVVPAQDLKFIQFYLKQKVDTNIYINDCVFGSYNIGGLQVTYQEGLNAVINEQTNTIINQTNKINTSIQELMDIFQQNAERQEDIYLNDTENEDGTCGGILCNLKKVVKGVINFPQTILTAIVDGLKSLFIPPDFTFLDDFRNSIENKLGFIAEVPIAIIDFTLNLATASWNDFDSISFPEIEIFGYKFWNSQEIDLTEAINIFKPFKYITDCLCVILCARTLNRWREKFTGGGD